MQSLPEGRVPLTRVLGSSAANRRLRTLLRESGITCDTYRLDHSVSFFINGSLPDRVVDGLAASGYSVVTKTDVSPVNPDTWYKVIVPKGRVA